MLIEDEDEALTALKAMNYYRLMGYSFHLQTKNNRYRPGTRLSQVLTLYEFDRRLRSAIIEYLEIVEITVRTRVAYYYSHELGVYGHYYYGNFRDEKTYSDFQNAMDVAVSKNRDAAFVKNHMVKYTDRKADGEDSFPGEKCNMPLWVIVEILSFSTLSKFYTSIPLYSLRQKIARSFSSDEQYFGGWLHSLANLRNTCAHYGRLYNRELLPRIGYDKQTYQAYRKDYGQLKTGYLFGYFIAILRLLPRPEQRTALLDRVGSLFSGYQNNVDLKHVGAPDWWQACFDAWKKDTP